MAKHKDRTILVTGATGHQGGAAVRHLRDRGFSVRALTRDPSQTGASQLVGHGTEVFRGDMEDPASITRALDGVYGVYSVQTPYQGGIEAELRQGMNVADAARRQRITHLVYSSVGAADQNTGIPHFDSKFKIEEHVRRSGLGFTIFRPVFFMENWIGMRQAVESGRIALPLSPSTRLQMIAVDDIGAFVAMAFEHAGKWRDRTFELAGDELSMEDVAQRLSRRTGREVRYEQVPWEQFEQQAGGEMALMYRWFEDHGYHVDIDAVRRERPELMTFDRWLNTKWPAMVSRA